MLARAAGTRKRTTRGGSVCTCSRIFLLDARSETIVRLERILYWVRVVDASGQDTHRVRP